MDTKKETALPLHSPAPTAEPPKKLQLFYKLIALAYVSFLVAHNLPSWHVAALARNPGYLIKADHGAVASENKLCSEIGVQILKQENGNAVDAAIATVLCIGVVNMYSSGIGGGGFMTVRIPPTEPGGDSEVWTIDFRERAPALANTTMFEANPWSSVYGGLAAGIPGEVRGLEEAHKRWASLPWETLIQPSVELAAGWKVDAELARRLLLFPELMTTSPNWKSIFAPNGRLLRQGEPIQRTNYSRTLATIAREGPDAFYEGPIADAFIAQVRATGGVISAEDMRSYRVKVAPAITGTYRDKKVYTTGAPTSGPAMLHMLHLLERFDLSGGKTALNVHRFIESLKFGFAARTWLGDPAFHNDTARIEEIATKEYADLVFPNITNRTHLPDYYHPLHVIKEDHGTSHTSVVDKDNMAVAVTVSINTVFASQVLDPETGIILNNEMNDFSLPPGVPNEFNLLPSPYNYPEPHKAPLSSMVPTIIENGDGSLHLILGASGGSRIFGSVVQAILNVDDFGVKDVLEAVQSGRVHDQLFPVGVDADDVVPEEVVDGLRERGHNVTVLDVNRIAAVVNAVHLDKGHIFAASDSRKNGVAAGY